MVKYFTNSDGGCLFVKNGLFKDVCMIEGNPNWERAISRQKHLYRRHDEIRNEFVRDYTRISFLTSSTKWVTAISMVSSLSRPLLPVV